MFLECQLISACQDGGKLGRSAFKNFLIALCDTDVLNGLLNLKLNVAPTASFPSVYE